MPNQEGFDIIVEVGGADTMSNSMHAIKLEAVITAIEIVTGVTPPESIMSALLKICAFRGIHVGSRALMEETMTAIEANGTQWVMDQRLCILPELRQALEYLVSITGTHCYMRKTNKN